MFRRNLLPVWLGIIFLSGMFLMGQDTWPPTCVDADGDGYGIGDTSSCTHPEVDCDDSNADVYPGAPELCDGIDNQCPGDLCYGEVDVHCGTPSPEMARIPCGCFDMGDHFGEGLADELPVHNVCISAFEMDVHEVTNLEYWVCEYDGGCSPPYRTDSATRSSYYGNPSYNNFPVINVNWDQAKDYCEWAGKRLPTEAEWEYAARGGLAGKRYPWGDTISGTDANYKDSGDPWDNDTSPVEYYPPNGYGLYDVAGNVVEWVNDWYQEDYYSVSPQNDPPGPVSGTWHLGRGGAWYILPSYLRLAYRFEVSSLDYSGLGFRCAY